AASATTLPLKPGVYVLAGSPCRDPAFAAMFEYDGRNLSYPHASGCVSEVVSHSGKHYTVRETCSALGDGTPAKPEIKVSTYTITSPKQVVVGHRDDPSGSHYRWCSAR
ncbi:MAG: hypothetical protein ACRYG4_13225, partial [Janthinobacterium lividum]